VALAVFAAAAVAATGVLLFRNQNAMSLVYVVPGAPFVLVVIVIYRLVAAYRHYLRFDRPFLTILASQLIAGLVVLNVFLFFAND